jgi:hypothetical protein
MDKVISWRYRADELRVLACNAETLDVRDALIKIAAQWDAMADRRETSLASPGPSAPRTFSSAA